MKRKALIILLALSLTLSLFTGCGAAGSDTETTSEKESASETESSTTETENTTESETETETSTGVEPSETESESTVPSESETPAPSESESTTPTESETPAPSESESTKPSETPSESESTTPPESEKPSEPTEPDEPAVTYTYTGMEKKMYVKSSVNVRDLPSTDGKKLGSLSKGEEVLINGKCNETGWYRFDFRGKTAYASSSYFTDENPVTKPSEDDKEDTKPSTTPSEKEPEVSDDGWVPAGTYKVNGYVITYDGPTPVEGFELDKKLANAGPYKLVYNKNNNAYYMLIEDADDYIKYDIQIRNYITELGGRPEGGGGNYSDIQTPGADLPLYQLWVGVAQDE